jgi:hypothetical protein
MLENTEGAIQNEKSRETGNIQDKYMLENTEGEIKKWKIQRNWQQNEENQAKTQHNMCWTTLCANKHK